ncbi:MAG: DUF4232 domain-containing protein [Acidimicrobiales bacterium]
MKQICVRLSLLGVTVALLAGCTSSSTPTTTTSTAPASGVVAWVATPAPPTTSTTTTTTTLAAAPSCTASELRVRAGRGGAATGNVAAPLLFTNAGASTCRLQGYPVLVGVTSAGGEVAIQAGHGTFFGNLVPTDLRPGSSGRLLLAGSDMCVGSPTTSGAGQGLRAAPYRWLIVELPDGSGAVRVRNRLPCLPLFESQLGVEPPLPGTALPGTLPFLQAAAQTPAQVRAGLVMRYVIVLTNPGTMPVSLLPCPGYTESLFVEIGGQERDEQRSYELNCRPLGRLVGHKSARFAMEIPVPAGAQAGVAKLGWSLNTGNGPYAGRGVTVSS